MDGKALEEATAIREDAAGWRCVLMAAGVFLHEMRPVSWSEVSADELSAQVITRLTGWISSCVSVVQPDGLFTSLNT